MMKSYRLGAAVAAFLLSLLLIGCDGAADETPNAVGEVPASASTVAVPTEEPTKPPPVVAVMTMPPADTVPATGPDAATADPAAGGDAPALPTAVPTEVPTEAPPTAAPTDTPVPTAVPPTAAPVIRPTAVPPTATAAPPTATPQAGANGLIASHFAIQSRAELTVNGSVWFEFTVANQTGGEVPYNALGVMPKKDGVDRPQWYQQTYGGQNSTIKPGGLSWEDRIKLPEAGNYTLRLVICFDGFDTCLQQRGTWHTLSAEIPVTIR